MLLKIAVYSKQEEFNSPKEKCRLHHTLAGAKHENAPHVDNYCFELQSLSFQSWVFRLNPLPQVLEDYK